MPEPLRYLLLPARPAGLLLIASLTVGFALCSLAGLFGLPIALILLYGLLAYSYVLLEQVAHGAREPPVLSTEMVNPASELRPLLQLALLLMLYLALRALAPHLATAALLGIGALTLAALPASIAVLGMADAPWHMVNPLALWHIVRALHWRYAAIVAVALLYGCALVALATAAAPGWLIEACALFAWLSLIAFIGGALYERREALGFTAMHAPERRAERAQRELEQQRARFIDALFAQARSGNLAGAWQSIEQALSEGRQAPECYEWLLERLTRLEDPRLANRLAQQHIHRLLGHDNGRVVEIVRERLARDADFHPRSAAETLRAAELARLAGDRAAARALLASFERHFVDASEPIRSAARRAAASLAAPPDPPPPP